MTPYPPNLVDLKRSEIGPARQWRKWPGNICQYNKKAYGKPDRYCLKLFMISLLAFCFSRTGSDYNNCCYHHQTVFHSEKTDLSLVNRIFVVMQKIVNNRTDPIKPKPQNKLYVCNRSRPMPNSIIKA